MISAFEPHRSSSPRKDVVTQPLEIPQLNSRIIFIRKWLRLLKKEAESSANVRLLLEGTLGEMLIKVILASQGYPSIKHRTAVDELEYFDNIEVLLKELSTQFMEKNFNQQELQMTMVKRKYFINKSTPFKTARKHPFWWKYGWNSEIFPDDIRFSKCKKILRKLIKPTKEPYVRYSSRYKACHEIIYRHQASQGAPIFVYLDILQIHLHNVRCRCREMKELCQSFSFRYGSTHNSKNC